MVRSWEGHRLPVFLTLCSLLLLFQIYVIFWQPHGTPSTTGGARRVLGEVAGTLTLTQSFEMQADGLDSITVYPAESRGARGDVVFELAELSGDPPTGQALFRAMHAAAEVGRGGPFTWRFSPVEGSRGRRYALTVSMPNATFGEGEAIQLQATRDERYTDGRLRYDGRDQWGDLVFSTGASRATPFRRIEHALRGRPAWLRSRVTLGALLLVYGLAFFAILWTVLAPVHDRVLAPDVEASRASRVRRLAAAALVVAAAAAGFWLVPRRPWLEARSVELLDALPEATLRTTMPSLQDGFVEGFVTAGRRRLRCLTALPYSRVNFVVDVPPGAEFAAWVGMRPDVWDGPGDGAIFRIGFATGGAYVEPWRRHFFPLQRPADRMLAPVRLDLADYAGQRIEVVLNTEPSFNAVGDAALWCEPRIVGR